jgi:N-acyl-D-aspartate/D-glutamate deacylase
LAPAIRVFGMPVYDMLIRNASVVDGSGAAPVHADAALAEGRIRAIGSLSGQTAKKTIDAAGLVLAPGFIDTHTHDDLAVICRPEMLAKLSQGVTTVIVGNCGISAAPVQPSNAFPDPMNLLGEAEQFRYPTFESYVQAVNVARPSVNVAALVGHTALRNNHMDSLDRAATLDEIAAMRAQLGEALEHGALGLSTGLAYLSASSASTEEVVALAESLAKSSGIYATHMRNEGREVLPAMEEAFAVAKRCAVPIVVSHLKCYGIDNWGRSGEVLRLLDSASGSQEISCDCYPYDASSTTLDLRQIDERVKITITQSTTYPELAGKPLSEIARNWGVAQVEAARRLQPAGAIYHAMLEDDMRTILRHPKTMIGSDGLPNDPRPHPRLWGTFPRVLGRYSRDQKLFPLEEAVHKMTGLPAERFRIEGRGLIREGFHADLVLFDPKSILDTATFDVPIAASSGIEAVWVNGELAYRSKAATGARSGRFLARQAKQ